MGQESPKPQIQAKYTPSSHASVLTSARKTTIPTYKIQQRVQCDGVLILRTTPFKNSIEIETESQILFLQNIQTTLKQLLESRLNTNKLFLAQDIEKLIEALTFTLALLQQKGVTYKDVTSENIYYDQGNFKLLPNELIENSTYQRLKNGQEVYPSPELIIALRCGEEDVVDEDIIEKSNVFTLGMHLLQVTTLMSSAECYDQENYDILDEVLNQRLVQVEEYYGERISRIVANMLDYDYTERMNLKEMSIWINRQLRQSKVVQTQQEQQLSTSMLHSQVQKAPDAKTSTIQNSTILNNDKGKSRMTKNNSVYMGFNRENQNQKQERNKIYINDSSRLQPSGSRTYPFQDTRNYKRNDKYSDRDSRTIDKREFYNIPFNQNDSFKFSEPPKHEFRHPNPYCEDFKYKREDVFQKNSEKDITQRINIQSHKPYLRRNYTPQNEEESERQRHPVYEAPKKQKGPLTEICNQYYPNIEDILKTKQQNQNNIQIKGPLGENGALNRIKEEIIKSRKLIEEFKKSQGIKF